MINRLVTVFVQLWRTSRLRFDDPVLENAFWVQHDRASVNLVRVAWAMAIVQFVVIGTVLLRTVTYGHGVISFAYFGSAIPVILLAFASTFVARLDRWRHAVIMATLVLSTVVVNVPFQWSDAPQGWVHAANILMVCFTFGFVAVRFRLAMMHAAFITLLFEFQLHMRPGSDTLHDLYASTFYFSVLAVSALAGFLLERSLRRNFPAIH
ncbi:MAG: hypothetical protein IPJ85_10255 [Flavobacteriales bacterium]|nr:hypothetical protein [Flavobacteriales bacterium]